MPASPQPVERDSSPTQWLVLREAAFWDRGRVLEFPATLAQGTIGRSPSCRWRVADPSVSRIHAALVRRPHRGVYLVDLASREGTFVNEERINGEMLLMSGDRIRLGPNVILEFVDGGRPTERPRLHWLRRLGAAARPRRPDRGRHLFRV